ncbi:hypothetical protein [Variovorax boronicumulans]|uniref:hypothetical protein n=1 Tax=Variovorax boronicumulans TaxID=436515 RepID=UPI00132F9911|nr:hypothetical protein [Variovorax boronicumulans]
MSLINVVSVSDIVESISKHVPKNWSNEGPLSFANFSTHTQSLFNFDARLVARLQAIKISGLNHHIEIIFQESHAAAKLDQCLHNAHEIGNGPCWFDWGDTGQPKISSTARSEAQRMLVHMSRWIDRFEVSLNKAQHSGFPTTISTPPSDGKYKNNGDSERLRVIGFKRDEIIEFLDSHNVPHSLRETSLSKN